MRISCCVLLLAISSISVFAADTYKFGRIADISAARLDVGDSDPMFCSIEIASPGVSYTFLIEGWEMKNCDSKWALHEGIWFRIAGQHVFIMQEKNWDIEGRVTWCAFEIRTIPLELETPSNSNTAANPVPLKTY
jgi:hypothetical protein